MTADPRAIDKSLCKLSTGTCLSISQTGTYHELTYFKLLTKNSVETLFGLLISPLKTIFEIKFFVCYIPNLYYFVLFLCINI